MLVIEDLIEQRKKEVSRFVDLLFIKFPNNEYRKIILFSQIPFRDSDDIYCEAAMYGSYYREHIATFRNLIKIMYRLCSNYVLEAETYIDNFCIENNIGLELLCSDFRMGGNPKYPYLKKEEEEKILKERYDIKDSLRNHAMGHYAEYLVYEELSKDDNLEVYWISKYLGDGYGYDFMVRNKKTNHCDFIEVKATDGLREIELSENEEKTFKEITDSNEDTTYHIYMVPMDRNLNYDIIDIYYDKDLTIKSLKGKEYTEIVPLEEEKYKKFSLLKGRI